MRLALVLLLVFAPAVSAQIYVPTPANERLAAKEQREALRARSLIRNVPLVNIGPTVQSGRVVDVDVHPADPARFVVAYASGGLWRTENLGHSFEPLFDHEAVMTLGDVAVDWQRGTLYAGTGENNSSRSSYAGTGVYKSTDGGASWQHLGLGETHHTGRIVLHPDDPNTVWVAALGKLYAGDEHRGVYKTTDGGVTWRQVLYEGPNTGAVDLAIDPQNPDVLYAAMWERTRRAWNLVEAGDGSGIYKSTDGGATWTRLNTPGSGFPSGEHVGRIGLALFPGDTDRLFAVVDNQARRPEEEDEDEPELTRETLRTMSRAAFLALGEEAIDAYLEHNGFPAAYTAHSVLRMVERGEIEPVALVEYLEDANQQLFETPVVGAEVYASTDGGQTWERTHEGYLDELFYSYGYYFGEVRVAPQDPGRLYLLGVPLLGSEDGGATWQRIDAEHVHVDHHALFVSPTRTGHLVSGNDGGINVSFDDGATWVKANTPAVGQFYAVAVDDAEPYRVYGGTQDNGVWRGPHTYEASPRWRAHGDYPYTRLLGGDGMQTAVDPRDPSRLYTGFQFGYYYRIEGAGTDDADYTNIRPQHELGERPYRFNWQTPIHLSRHNPDILYLGSERVHRSLDRGDTWEAISPDLTHGGRAGDVPYATLTSIDENPFRFGLLWTGSDDGRVHVSRDGGYSWSDVSAGLPDSLWVTRVEASHHEEARAYATLNGYRYDLFTPYLYRTDDYGQTWTRLGEDLPAEALNVVLEDPQDERLLYVGSDHGLYVSLDGGASFMTVSRDLPATPVHDLALQTRERDLVVGTHGRSLYRMDVDALGQLPALVYDSTHVAVHLFQPDSLRRGDWGERSAVWQEVEQPEAVLTYFARDAGPATLHVETEDGSTLYRTDLTADAGLNLLAYGLVADAERAASFEENEAWQAASDGNVYLAPGNYRVTVEQGGASSTRTLRVSAPRSERPSARPTPGEVDRDAMGKG